MRRYGDAEKKFQEVAEANEVLSDEELLAQEQRPAHERIEQPEDGSLDDAEPALALRLRPRELEMDQVWVGRSVAASSNHIPHDDCVSVNWLAAKRLGDVPVRRGDRARQHLLCRAVFAPDVVMDEKREHHKGSLELRLGPAACMCM